MNEDLLNGAKFPDDEWPDLVPLDMPDLPQLNLACLPGWAGDYASALSAATETPPELAGGMVLATCATAAARRLEVTVRPGYSESCNLWLIAALSPGNRKSAVQIGATIPLMEWEMDQSKSLEPEIKRITSERTTLEARAKMKRSEAAKSKDQNKVKALMQEVVELEAKLPDIPTSPHLWTSDVTPERLGPLLADHGECMAWLSSEGGIFDLLQGRYSGGILNLDLILKAHSGDPERVDRGSRPSVLLHRPRLSIGLSPQPDVLRGLAAKPGFRGRGLLGRFLYLLPPSPLGFRNLNPEPMPDGLQRAYITGLRAMLDWKPANNDGKECLHVLRLCEGAITSFADYAHAIEKMMRPGIEMEHFSDWAGKAPGASIRLAGVLHGIRHAHERPWEAAIEKETMMDAIAIMSVIEKHSLAALDVMGADSTVASARHLLEWIKRNRQPHFSSRHAFNALRGTFPHMSDLNEALGILEERSYVRVIKQEKEGPGRKPSPLVLVRPDIHEKWK